MLDIVDARCNHEIYCTSIGNFEGVHTQIFLMYQAMACSQIAIKFLLHFFCNKRTHVTVSSFHSCASSVTGLSSLYLDVQTL